MNNNIESVESENDIPSYVHILCGYPLVMIFIGGAIGGALGGLAYGVNIMIYKSNLSLPIKIIVNLATGALVVVVWLVLASVISS